ncbi:MAG: carbohydrate-binding domain-containing protein, partial [Prevotellaceae bacterium]|nr:carbohydrate-binding domain-containing protein [Prevotellaceae bacterium]
KKTFCFIIAVANLVSFAACKSDRSTEEAPRTYAVSGIITKSEGGAASGASIMLIKISDNSDAGQSPTNAAGEYIITGVGAGSYKIVATLNGYETGAIDEIKIVDSDVTGKDLMLQKITVPTYAVSGAVAKSDGSAAAGASVKILKASDNTNAGQPATTNASGEYSISGIPAGVYNIVITLDGYETGTLVNVSVKDSDLTVQNLTLQTIVVDANAISIIYSDNDATVDNPYSDGSVTVSKSGADVTIASSSSELVKFYISGATSGGSLKIQNNATEPNTLHLTLNSAVIASSSKLPPIQITKNEGVTVLELKGASILSDNTSNEENATLISKSGSLEFEGYGKLVVSGAAKHAIASSKKSITVRGGEITVTSAASDGLHAEVGFVQSGGSLDLTASGDGIDAGSGTAEIRGGNIRIISSTDDTKGIKADAGITVSGGVIDMNVSGAQSKGISSKADINISGGDISVVASGAAVLEEAENGYDPSYCTAIKSDANIGITGGTIQIESLATADGGKGVSADGDISISGGTLNIAVAGDGKVYTAATGSPDSYTATCIKSDQNITLSGGNIRCSSSGTGGKCINADGSITIGNPNANNADLVLVAGASGERFYVAGSQGGKPGFGDNGTDYANPKAIKCEGDMTVNSGTIYINCTQKTEGGEGLESKSLMTINGGNIDIRTYDDCINAETGIVINGGNIFCAASGQDAIDSNSALTINGGLTIANGIRGDGEAFDFERNFQINGGIVVGTHGGGMSMTNNPAGQQRSVRIQGAAGSAIGIKNAAEETLLLFNIPVIAGATEGSAVVVVFSDPRLVSGSYVLLSGGSISGGTTVNGYNTGGTYTGGTSKGFDL